MAYKGCKLLFLVEEYTSYRGARRNKADHLYPCIGQRSTRSGSGRRDAGIYSVSLNDGYEHVDRGFGQ